VIQYFRALDEGQTHNVLARVGLTGIAFYADCLAIDTRNLVLVGSMLVEILPA
jgi:hypothetical protein